MTSAADPRRVSITEEIHSRLFSDYKRPSRPDPAPRRPAADDGRTSPQRVEGRSRRDSQDLLPRLYFR